MACIYLNLILLLILRLTMATAPSNVLILISSQDSSYHRRLSENLRKDIIQQSHSISLDYLINVRLFDEILNHPGDWTLLTILPQLTAHQALINENTKWIIACEESTGIQLEPLLQRLERQDHTKLSYFGYPLFDREPTIIHHFAYYENPQWFQYPMLRSGVIFSAALLCRVAELVARQGVGQLQRRQHSEFSIDASHELARFILDNVLYDEHRQQQQQLLENEIPQQHCSGNYENGSGSGSTADRNLSKQGKAIAALNNNSISNASTSASSMQDTRQNSENVQKIILKRASYVCPAAATQQQQAECLLYAKPSNMATCQPLQRQQIYFAIKTCQRYHEERLASIRATWAKYAIHKTYFSDVEDAEIPTTRVHVPNMEVGHCAKTLAILKLALKHIEQINRNLPSDEQQTPISWIFICDDDTLLSIAGVCELLGCFDTQQPIYLGERYGYRLFAPDGFNYITGGGGIALTLPLAELIVKQCSCPSASSPDDMILGACLNALHIKAIHSNRFHQARPLDYAPELLQLEPPISFHKFWQLDPLSVYQQWFAKADSQYQSYEPVKKTKISNDVFPNKSKIYATLNGKYKPNQLYNRADKQNHKLVHPSTELMLFQDVAELLSVAKDDKHLDL